MASVKPFFYYSSNFPKILQNTGGSLVYSTYQAGKLIFISSLNGTNIAKYAKNFKRPMGLAYDSEHKKLAVASKSAVDIFSSTAQLSKSYPKDPKKYDTLFIPQATYQTGILDTHEINWYKEDLLLINTLFSNISTLDHVKHFKLYWKPEWITALRPEDRCHLNGFCFENGHPKYATCFAKTDEKYGWREAPYNSGLLIDVATNEVLIEGLAMPHSPILIEEDIYLIESATGHVIKYNRATKEKTILNQFNTFLRGMDIVDEYIFIGASKIREDSSFFGKLPIKPQDSFSGIIVLDRKTGKQIGGLTYTDHIKEIFSLKFLPGVLSPAILTERDEMYNLGIMAEDINYWVNKEE
ncbi:MAG: hypothetical protein ACJAT1_001012 [Marivirga sp.]|jgi:uncharacterized protein (TIGR03032 family)